MVSNRRELKQEKEEVMWAVERSKLKKACIRLGGGDTSKDMLVGGAKSKKAQTGCKGQEKRPQES